MTTVDLPAALADLRGYIRSGIAAGFAAPDAVAEAAVGMLAREADAALLRPRAHRYAFEALAGHMAEQAAWPQVTDCDRLDRAFAALEAGGVICRHDFSCCGTCGAFEIWGEVEAAQAAGRPVRGYAFYHAQDTEAAVAGEGLHLSYGATAGGERAALAIGRDIVVALGRQGLPVEWDGRWAHRIEVPLIWRRRRGAAA